MDRLLVKDETQCGGQGRSGSRRVRRRRDPALCGLCLAVLGEAHTLLQIEVELRRLEERSREGLIDSRQAARERADHARRRRQALEWLEKLYTHWRAAALGPNIDTEE